MEEVHDDDQRVTMQHKIEIMRQVASACEALALQGIVHRHIAARNVLLSAFDLLAPSTTVANVSDFGMSVSAYRRSCLTVDGGAVRMTCMAHQSLQRKQRRVLLPRVVLRVAERWQTTFCTGSQRRSSCAHDGAGERLAKRGDCDDGVCSLVQCCCAATPSQPPSFHELSSTLSCLVVPPVAVCVAADVAVAPPTSCIFIQVLGEPIVGGNTLALHATSTCLTPLTRY